MRQFHRNTVVLIIKKIRIDWCLHYILRNSFNSHSKLRMSCIPTKVIKIYIFFNLMRYNLKMIFFFYIYIIFDIIYQHIPIKKNKYEKSIEKTYYYYYKYSYDTCRL